MFRNQHELGLQPGVKKCSKNKGIKTRFLPFWLNLAHFE